MPKRTAGQKFKADFLAMYESDRVTDAAALDLAAQLLDECEEMAARIKSDGYMIVGSQQQPVVNPLIRELRAHTKAFIDVAKKLEPGEGGSAAGRALANARWRRAS